MIPRFLPDILPSPLLLNIFPQKIVFCHFLSVLLRIILIFMLKPYSTHWSVGKRKKPLQIWSLISCVLNQSSKFARFLSLPSLLETHFIVKLIEFKTQKISYSLVLPVICSKTSVKLAKSNRKRLTASPNSAIVSTGRTLRVIGS